MQGLRDRKKAATRQAISDVATRLFEARGFEAVTVEEVAAAAGVARKTVFNYFATKEELFFDREDALLDEIVRRLLSRPAGSSPTAAVAGGLLNGPVLFAESCSWGDLKGDLYDGLLRFSACERASPTLRAHRLVITHSWRAPVAAAAGGSQLWAALFLAVLELRQDRLADALAQRRTPATVKRRVQATARAGLDAIEQAVE